MVDIETTLCTDIVKLVVKKLNRIPADFIFSELVGTIKKISKSIFKRIRNTSKNPGLRMRIKFKK